MSAKLSVVVPMNNVEDYLSDCLGSLAAQTLRDLEIILVDDGSLDGTAVIAKRFAERDPRFRVVQQENLGPGAARNHGIQYATGEYLAFADGDDVVPPDAYAVLVGSLERSGSDLACGNAQRIDADRRWQSWIHEGVFKKTTKKTRISERPLLVRDRTVWNKVFRRSFWDANGFSFPDGLYEDVPVAMAAHLAASAIDVIDEVVYYWRKRSGSITDARFDRENFAQRVDVSVALRERIAAAGPEVVAAFDEHSLIDVDVRVLLEGLPRASDEDRPALMEIGARAVRTASADVRRRLPALLRLQLYMLEHGRLDELLEVLAFIRLGRPKSVRYVKRGLRSRWFAEYPYFDDPATGFPADLYDVTDELEAVAHVDSFEWAGDRLRIEGHAYIGGVDASEQSDLKLRLWLVADDKIGFRKLSVERVRRPDVTANAKQSSVSCEWSGFVTEVDPASLKVLGRRRDVDWRLVVEINAQGVKRRRNLGIPRSARQRWPLQRELADGVYCQVIASRWLRLRARVPGAVVLEHHRVGDDLEFIGTLAQRPDPKTRFVAALPRHGVKIKAPLEISGEDGGRLRFRTRVPLAELGGEKAVAPDAVDAQLPTWEAGVGASWTLELSDGTKLLLHDGPDAADARYTIPGREGVEFAVSRTRFDHISGYSRPALPMVTSAVWEDDDRLVLGGDWAGGEARRPQTIVLRRNRSSQEHLVDLDWDGDRFTAAFSPRGMPQFGLLTALGRGNWNVRMRTGEREIPVLVERRAMRSLPEPHVSGFHSIEIHSTRVEELQLRVRAAHRPEDAGGYAQRMLQTVEYPRFRTQPLLNLALFDAFDGRQMSDNPRGVFNALRRRDPEMECVWVTRDGQFPHLDGARTVLSGSREHYEALGRAKLIVGNWRQPEWFEKRPDQIYVQCWHGTPLKKIGYDLKEMPYKRTEGVQWMEKEVPQWNFLVAQNAFSTPLFRSAFRYEGEIIETGYPRDDLLNQPERHTLEIDVRRRLGIPPGKKVIMYAPTWRDDFHFAVGTRAFELQLDLDRLGAELGDDHVLLLRTHYLVTDKPRQGENPFVIDVSDYPDIAELYLTTDVFITDYSSSMFDFAVTGKPMLFYTYDLDRYRDHVRGFYFDFEAESPGPLLRTSDEVLQALRELPDVSARYAVAYAAFREKYCPHDDGHAGDRVLDRALGER
ncbi:bifunctional glycosyltransferase/CDP-glycerol:glycerophosphate glycerophosphotransferase [Actinomadura atramentaria]|uniref:bifunctional glycosyltransferase/CDP-glycerol:glycerophosphate glycerophosphotransferase n=1 Tax=Actinomadura atramentaria TaxID=1990 RepID=UPI00035F2F15|nr:bifunctional glycosyltransferase family 2 protein/CDP-glycerol:glycerophosphate glycerophosphotransferase [Actinomadura atramentaria]